MYVLFFTKTRVLRNFLILFFLFFYKRGKKYFFEIYMNGVKNIFLFYLYKWGIITNTSPMALPVGGWPPWRGP
jgi:hypothetical protein